MILNGKKHVIFDWDGTLVDSLPMWENADIEMLKNLGKVPRETIGAERKKFLSKHSNGDIYLRYNQYLIDTYGIEEMTADLINLERFKVILKASEEMDLKKDAETFMILLRKYGFTLSLATLSAKKHMDFYRCNNPKIIAKTDRFRIFDGVILTKDDVENKKPNPEIYLKALEELGANKDEVVVIEDSLVGILSARSAGIQTISIYDRYNDEDREKINRYADFVVSDYKSLIKMIH